MVVFGTRFMLSSSTAIVVIRGTMGLDLVVFTDVELLLVLILLVLFVFPC